MVTSPLPVYLGPALPRWTPTTIDDVQAAISSQLLAESHWLDVKRELGGSNKNKNIAADMASFATDGGMIIYGIAEDKAANTMAVEPIDLRNQPERIDQIARTLCDPPLFVTCRPMAANPDDQTSGILLVGIPPSAGAPHMADGRYRGRAGTTNTVLNDSEVMRLHAVRSARQRTAEQLIDAEIARDPVPKASRANGHLYVVAEPIATPPDWLTEAIDTPLLPDLVWDLTRSQTLQQGGWPNLHEASRVNRRLQGLGLSSIGLSGRQLQPEEGMSTPENHLVDIEISDNGRVTLFNARATSEIRNTGGAHQINDALITVQCRGAVEIAGMLGAQLQYGGRWLIAIGATELGGRLAARVLNSLGLTQHPFSADRYIEGTEATTVELRDRPDLVTRRLLRRLLRGLNLPVDAYLENLFGKPS